MQPANRTPGEVHVLVIDGVINALTARYLEQGLRGADRAHAVAVVLQLNTPGGLETSMREMMQVILASPVPVIVFVAPAGARAASAGMFVMLAGHVAAMAPATNVGAAHPIGLGAQRDSVALEKVVNDAAALARSIAAERGRNADWAEKAVRESVSVGAEDAVNLNVADFIARNVEDLLGRVDGRTVRTVAGEVTLRTAQAPLERVPMSLPTRILHILADPNIAYLLMSLGTIGLIAELYSPGMLFPGITGVICLILAFVSFGSLPINWAAVLLLLLAAGLIIADLYIEGVGLLSVGGVIAFVLGSLMLYRPIAPVSPTMPDVRVSRWLIMAMTAGMISFLVLVGRALIGAQRAPVTTGVEALVGRTGVAVSELRPTGTVRVNSERWRALAQAEAIAAGEPIRVTGVDGVTLRVARAESPPGREDADRQIDEKRRE